MEMGWDGELEVWEGICMEVFGGGIGVRLESVDGGSGCQIWGGWLFVLGEGKSVGCSFL
jgi:hypothetical protein